MRTFKEGDKLLCCRPYDGLKIGKYYDINIGPYGPYNCFNVSGFWFAITRNSSFPYIYDYFFTEKEERKLKLQVIKLHSKI